MDKRKFLKVSGIVGAGVMVSPLMSCNPMEKKAENSPSKTPEPAKNLIFEQSALGFDYSALEPHIDARTMEIHFSKHHAGYVRKLNKALTESPSFNAINITDLLSKVTDNQTGIRNNGGGHYNHTLFWECMAPGGASKPTGKLAEAINSSFGSFEEFKTVFSSTSKKRFGSGWGWLSVDSKGKLFVSSTPNQDNPLMTNIIKENGTPILGVDVWEHAYYLKYQNLRGDYVNAFMDVINWDVVGSKFAKL